MKKDKKSSRKEFVLFRWLRRMFFGASKELTMADERYDSPSKLAVKRFFRRPLATCRCLQYHEHHLRRRRRGDL